MRLKVHMKNKSNFIVEYLHFFGELRKRYSFQNARFQYIDYLLCTAKYSSRYRTSCTPANAKLPKHLFLLLSSVYSKIRCRQFFVPLISWKERPSFYKFIPIFRYVYSKRADLEHDEDI